MGFLIIETSSDKDLVWWAELAKKVGVHHDYRFGDYRGIGIEDVAQFKKRDERSTDKATAKAGKIKNRFTHKIAKKCGRKSR